MGRSAKLHKRAKKTTNSSISAVQPAAKTPAANVSAVQEQKRRTGLKAKATKRKKDGVEGPVLDGADYVDLMLGGRRKALEEAAKLPKED
ncbi:hypothetical protein WOLCODRAFT_75229 [Wolfiporia cocos MD-104 SS10]|uniref:Uncharacterized protein n=1 Tax=Wolfiporia cocos (strain MD-104) TaxID=742152 RepID=A0A2H3JP27_WOLCO|nr:hypothetical protein WOLCODRAFT_75229 [Wolfiporia cocos MD-104 SS10]